MKKLILVRHAKSSWKNAGLDDHDRSLNKRGERDAPFMAKELKKKDPHPDLLVSSTAVRAFMTARIFAKALGFKKEKIQQEKGLYLADLAELTAIVNALPDDKSKVCLFGHNPGITLLVNYLCNAGIDNVPTCGICSVSFPVESWQLVTAGSGKLEFFVFPKMYFKDVDD